jgi:DNA-directed RNA polymerase specialized sigma24 family protein
MSLEQVSSWALVGLVGEDHREARREFAFRYDKFVRRVLAKRWLGTAYRNHFDDAVQDVFVECFKPGGVLEKADRTRGGAFRSLLFRVTCHVAARFERAHHRDSRIEANDFADTSGQDNDAYRQLTREEVGEVVRGAIRRMQQKIIHLAAGDTQVAGTLHRQHSKAKLEFQSFLGEVVEETYRVPPEEVSEILQELLSVLE